MVKYRSSIIVPFARERVWKLMSDWTNLSKWDTNITKSHLAKQESPNATGLGTKYDCAFALNGLEIAVDYECIKFEPSNVCHFVGLARFFKSQDSLEFETVADGTKLTAEFNLCFRGLLSPFSFAMNGSMQKIGPVVMEEINKFVEEQLHN